MRRAVLGAVVSQRFAHPNRILHSYDSLRSIAVHGELRPEGIDRDLVEKLASDVRQAIEEVLVFIGSEHIQTRKTLLKRLEQRPEWNQVQTWLLESSDEMEQTST